MAVSLLLTVAGMAVLALLAIAAGTLGFGIVFNLRRPWWGEGGQAAAATVAPVPWRVRVSIVAMLLVVTAVVLLVELAR